jgi:peptide/nickel transport system substrate-binding protein
MKSPLNVTLVATVTAAAVMVAPATSSTAAPLAGASATIPLLRVGTTFPEPNLDLAKNYAASMIDNVTLEALLKIGPQGQLEPELATSWSRTSPVTYVYHLRHGVEFWDGDQLTAADVAYSLNYERAPSSQVSFGYPTTVKSITAVGQYTVVVTLTQPNAAWNYDVAYAGTAGIFEMKFALEHKGTFGDPGVFVMGTGPWEVDSLDPTRGAQLSANPHWWGGTVPIKNISFTFFSNETSEALAFRAGEIDLVNSITDPSTFAHTAGTKIIAAPSCWSGYFAFNTGVAPWNDVHVRRAVAYALDRKAVIAANGGYASPNYTLIPPMMLESIAPQLKVNALLSSINLYPNDLAKARAEMAESAYPNGASTTILAYSYSSVVNISQVVAADLSKIGIKAKIKVVTLSANEAIATGPVSKRMSGFTQSGCDTPDPSWYTLDLSSSGIQDGNDAADYTSPLVDRLITVGNGSSSPPARFAAYSGILRQLAVDVPYVPLYIQDIGLALSPRFSDPSYSQWAIVGDYAMGVEPA